MPGNEKWWPVWLARMLHHWPIDAIIIMLVKLEVNELSSVKAVNDKQTITDDFDAFQHPMLLYYIHYHHHSVCAHAPHFHSFAHSTR